MPLIVAEKNATKNILDGWKEGRTEVKQYTPSPSGEIIICDKFNLEALTVNQVKSFKALADGKDVFIGTKTESGIFAYISSITCAPCKTYSDWIRVLVAITNEILKRESSKCILDPPRVERRGT